MELHFAQSFIQYLHHNQHHAGLIAAGITFFESLAVVGTFVPGSVTLGAVGTLIGSATIPAISTIIYIVLGAFLGDFLSYGIGRYYKERIATLWPFSRYPKLLQKSRMYCRKHGGKSILIGRFTGPMRSFVPLITGMMHMSVTRFICVSLPSALAWVLTFLAPGILLGALSHEIPASMATEFILAGLAIILLIWFFLWCITHFFEQIAQAMHDVCQLAWKRLRRRPMGKTLSNLIANIQEPTSGTPLLRCLIIFTCLTLLAILWALIHTKAPTVSIDTPIYHLIRSLRTPSLEPTMVAFTLLGKSYCVALATLALIGWLAYRREFRYAACLCLGLVTGMAAIFVGKHLGFLPRPAGLLHQATGSSFPSGHVTLITTIMCLLAIWIKDLVQPKWRWLPVSIASVFITLIAISRLYLGAHWLSDVLAGLLLGLSITHATLLIFWRDPPIEAINHRHFSIAIVTAFACAWLAYGYTHYTQALNDSTPIYQLKKIDMQQWWKNANLNPAPLIRTNRFGQPDHVLNIQWVGQAKDIASLMQQHGWKIHPTTVSFNATLHRLAAKEALPLLPKLYQDKPPALLFTLHREQYIILRLWQSNTQLEQSNQILWLGTIGVAKQRQHIFNVHQSSDDEYRSGHLDVLIETLKQSPFTWKTPHITSSDETAQSLHWDKQLIFIQPKARNSN